ncbi:MAG: LapA family protein [Burkholderiales bacterium]|nr:LapA family protein [Burkholderiales bacterium]
MRYVMRFVKFAVFVAVLSFAVKNGDPVTLRYFLGAQWQAPLIFVLLVAFCAGAAFGVLSCVGQLYRQRREIARLKSGAREGAAARGDPAPPPGGGRGLAASDRAAS